MDKKTDVQCPYPWQKCPMLQRYMNECPYFKNNPQCPMKNSNCPYFNTDEKKECPFLKNKAK